MKVESDKAMMTGAAHIDPTLPLAVTFAETIHSEPQDQEAVELPDDDGIEVSAKSQKPEVTHVH